MRTRTKNRAANKQIKLEIQRLNSDVAKDAAGHVDPEAVASWETITSRFFEVFPKGSREFYRAQTIEATVTHVVRTNWDSTTKDITPKDRLKFADESRYLDIAGVWNVEERNREILFSCIEQV